MSSNTNPGLRRDQPYPIAHKDWRKLPVAVQRLRRDDVAAMWPQQVRAPREGEWYLSGSVIEAHCAPSNLDKPYPIAYLVRVEYRAVFTDI